MIWCEITGKPQKTKDISTKWLTIQFTFLWFECLNSLRPRRNRRHFADDIFNRIFLNENAWIPIKISLKFVPKGPINDIPALVQIMAWHRPGAKPLSEPMMVIYWRIYASLGLNELRTWSECICCILLHFVQVIYPLCLFSFYPISFYKHLNCIVWYFDYVFVCARIFK